ncbi:MAG: collagen-binding domain-containing protein [Tateyamaria sp.]|uniref:collagen-binding domain-containing protein n=1 Tax=Tateyamaria sp. TaxID=1929288 RepID=UPI0032A07CBE
MRSSYCVSALFVLVFSVLFVQFANAQDRHPLTPITGELGQPVLLDPTGIPWLDGQSFQPVWSWLERPATSVAEFSDSGILRPSFIPDVAGTWVAQLDLFSNTNSAAPELSALVHISTENTPPVSFVQARGLPDQGLSLVLDGTRSFDVEGDKLTYAWSLLSAPDGHAAAFAAPSLPLTEFSFDLSGTYQVQLTVQDELGLSADTTFDVEVSGGGVESGFGLLNDTLGTFNLVTRSFFGRQEVQGRTYIGSSVQNITGQFGFAPAQDGADFDELYIDGDLQNSTVNLTPGDVASISGNSINSNVNNGALVQNATDIPSFDFQTLRDQSAFLASLTGAPADLSDQNNKRFGGAPNAIESEGAFGPNTRIVTASLQDLQSGGYSIDLSQADTVIINVSGQFGSFQMNPLGGTGFAENVLWNFYEATSINVNSVIVGHVLAPYARMSGFAGSSEGSVIADDVQLTNGELHQRLWLGQVPAEAGQIGGARAIAPEASARFDQLVGMTGTPILLESYGSTDIDGDSLTASSTLISGPVGANATLQADELGIITFVADLAGDYIVGINVTDGTNVSRDQVLISVDAGNVRPVARIENVAATLGALTQLDGTQSFDLDGDLIGYEWSILSAPNGSTSALGGSDGPYANLIPDVPGLYVVQLAVDDGNARSVPTTLALNVGAPLPVADAGFDQLADANGQALLDGSLSQGDTLTYVWSAIGLAGGVASLDDASLVTPLLALPSASGMFRDLIAEQVVYEIRRSNLGGLCAFDTRVPSDIPNPAFTYWHGIAFWASGQVASGNGHVRPIWVIDNQRDFTREITLQGTDGSSHGTYIVPGRTRAYVSTSGLSNGTQMRVFLEGNQVQQAGPSTWNFNHTEEVCGGAGAQVAQLIVADANGISLPDSVFVGSGNLRPVLNRVATVEANGPVTLNASDAGFDANGDDLSYSWSLIYRPANSNATITGGSQGATVDAPNITFAADAPGTYLVQLEANDGSFIAEPVVWVISVSNSVPVADAAAPTAVFIGETVTLDGSASSDPNGDALSFQWTLTSVPAGSIATIPDPFAPIASFVPDLRGIYTAELVVSDFQSPSAPASISISTENRAPIAVLTGIDETAIADPVVFSATDSTDPDGDPLNYAFTVSQGPNGHNAMIEFFSEGQATFVADLAGDYIIQVTVSDGLAAATTTAAISATASNSAPVLDALNANYDVEVGLSFVLPLNAMDPDGDSVSYFARPLPLPAGMLLDAATGKVIFAPESGAEGVYEIVFGATDGLLTDEETVTFTVIPADAGETALSGLVLDAQDFANGIQTPIADVSVRLAGAGAATSTDVFGRFDFTNLIGGSDTLQVQPDNSVLPIAYSSESRPVRVTDNQSSELVDAILLTRLQDGCADVVPGIDTILDSATSGVRVEIPADSIFDTAGAPYSGEVCLGSLPQQTVHPGFEDGTQACQIYALDAQNAVFNQGLSISAPNVDNLPVGARATLWQLQEGFGRFASIGRGEVTADSSSIITAKIDVRDGSSLFTFLPQRPRTSKAASQFGGLRELTPFNGDNNFSYELPGYTSFGEQQYIGLSYHSQSAQPVQLLESNVKILDDASLPLSLTSSVRIEGLSVQDDNVWTVRNGVNGLSPAVVGEEVLVSHVIPLDTTGFISGRYNLNFEAQAHYECSTVVGSHSTDLLVQLQEQSPYGVGWSIDELQTLVVEEDGSVLIFDDDMVTSFEPENRFTEFDNDPVVIPADYPIDLTVTDFDGDGRPDIFIAESGPGDIKLVGNLGDRDFEDLRSFNVAGVRRDIDSDNEIEADLTSIVTTDFDRDGFPDIPYAAQGDEIVGVLLGNGTTGFTNDVLFSNDETRNLVVADIDEDGFDDVIYGSTTGFFVRRGEIRALFGGPDGFIDERIANFSEGGIARWVSPLQLIVDDIDGDGRLDVAMRSERGIHFAFGQGGRDFDVVTTDLADDGFFLLNEHMQLSDVDGDGLKDLFTILSSGFVYYRNTTGRGFGDPVQLATPPGAISDGNIFLVDADQDGLEDILFSLGDALTVYSARGDGTFAPGELSSINHRISGRFSVEDMNGDGFLDLVSFQGGENGSVTIDFSVANQDGSFVATNGEFSELRALPDGGWERRYKDGMIVEFNADGLQTATVDRQGNRKEYEYGSDGELLRMFDQAGGMTAFNYTEDGLLASVTYPDGRVTQLDYDGRNLAQVTEPLGTIVSFEYDENGRLVNSTNQNGNTTNYIYDSAGNLAGSILPDESTVNSQVASSLGLIDGLGGLANQPLIYVRPEDRMTTVTDRKGELTTVEVNEFGSVIRTVDPLGRENVITRDENNLAIRVERPSDANPAGIRVDEIEYDQLANVTLMREAVGTPAERATQYEYEPVFNKVTRMVDPDGFEMLYEYDDFGEVTKIVDGENGERLLTYEIDGKLATRTDENSNLTAFAYDAMRNLNKITYANGSVTGMVHDLTGNVVVIAEAQGTSIERQIQRTYDSLNRVLSLEVTGADGAQIEGITTYNYLPAGNLETVTDETGLVTSMTYDPLERLVSLDDPAEGLIQRTYNAAGEVTRYTNGDGELHTYVYDEISRLIQHTDPEGFIKSFTYDKRDNIQIVTDGRSGVTLYTFDTLDRVLLRTNPIGEAITFTYDARGNLASLTRQDGVGETATYDGLSRRTGVITPDNTLRYVYDPNSNLVEATDDDSSVTFTYDERNRLAASTTDGTVGPQPEITLTYTYDFLDRRTSMSDSLGGSTNYDYDPEDRLTELTTPWGAVYSFGYDDEGRRTSLTSSSGRATTYTYENDLLTRLEHAQSGVPLVDQAFSYGPDAQLAAILDNLEPSKSKVIAHDDLNRLVQISEGIPINQGGAPIPVEDYAYDEEGNRLASHLSALYSSNEHNQLFVDDDYHYAYDAKGNRISRMANAGGDVETYTYDSQNRLIRYASPTTTASYVYDALDRRIAKVVNGVVSAYVYDFFPADPLAHDDITLEFSDGVLTRRWTHSNKIDEPIGFEDYLSTSDAGSGSERLIFTDRQGSVIRVTEPNTGSIIAAYEYGGFGTVTQTTGELDQPYRYTGREFDAESGLYHYRMRAYDSNTGLFMQSDPIGFEGGSFSLYSYVSNNPFELSDPSGLAPTVDFVNRAQADIANSISRNTDVAVGAIFLAGEVNAILSAGLPFAIKVKGTEISSAPPGVCSSDVFNALQAEVNRWRTSSCTMPLPGLRHQNLVKLRKFARLAKARATLAAVCFPGYYGKGDHRDAVEQALVGMHKCQAAVNLAPYKAK